jgi:hypothetical protein
MKAPILAAVGAMVLALVSVRSLTATATPPGAAPAQAPAAAPAKMATEAFKNIQVLKNLNAEQLTPAMNLIAASLGVECTFCHVQGANEKDDLPNKATARRMMAMTIELNKSAFNGRPQVTCFSCHRGAKIPVAAPIIPEVETPPVAAAPVPAALPPAQSILDKYVAAVGGLPALQRITTRIQHGNLLFGANKTPIDVYAKAPNKRVSVSHSASGDSFTAFDGAAGWLGNTGRPARDMNGMESKDAGLDAEFSLALRAATIFQSLRTVASEKIGGKDMNVVAARGAAVPDTKLYFDPDTGLLMRLVRLDDTGIGGLPVQIDYADYRAVDGIKIPFRWTLARTNGRFTIQIDSVEQNVPIDDAKFAKPGASLPVVTSGAARQPG